MKRLLFILYVILTASCEASLDYSRIDSRECIYISTLIGNTPTALIISSVVIPMSSDDFQKCEKEVGLSGTIGGKSIRFLNDNYFVPEIHQGDKIEIKARANGAGQVHAETTVPEEIRLVGARIVSKEDSFITFEIVYEEDEEDEGFYGIRFPDTTISEAPGILLAESYDMIVSGTMLGQVLIWDRHKVRKEGNTVTFRTSVDIRSGSKDSYDVKLYSLSPETFYHLRGEYMKISNFPSVGMGTPAFTYSNVIGGIGIAGSFWETDTTLKL